MKFPAFLKDYPEAAAKLGAAVYRAKMAIGGDHKAAESAALQAIAARYTIQDGQCLPVEGAFVESQTELAFRAAQAEGDPSGLTWEAVLIAPGLSKHNVPFYWDEAVLEAATPLFVNADVNAYEIKADTYSHVSMLSVDMLEDFKRYLTQNKVGYVENAWYEAGVGIKAIIRFLPDHAWLPNALKTGAEQGNPNVLGLSIDSRIKGYELELDGWTAIWVHSIKNVMSVDVVTYPAAGGRFLRALMARQQEEQNTMTLEQLLALIGKARPDLLKGKDTAKMSMEEATALAQMAMQPVEKDKGNSMKDEPKPATPPAGVTQEDLDKRLEAFEARAACARDLDAQLAGCDLPVPAVARIRAAFDAKTFKPADLTAAIKAEKDYIAAMSAPVLGLGDDPRAGVGFGQLQKIQLAVDKTFGLTRDSLTQLAQMSTLDGRTLFDDRRAAQDISDYWAAVPQPRGIKELYVMLTGDAEVSGRFQPENIARDLRAAQDTVTSSTFSYVLGNTMHRRMVADYRAFDFLVSLLISTSKSVTDFRTQEAVNVGYFGDLPTVEPETGNYAEVDAVTDEESTYSLLQKGNILPVSRKIIINNDIGLIQRLVTRLSRAAARTHAKYVWAFFTGNATCSDGTAWFTSGHGNLGATALSFSTALIAYKALAAFTEKDSGESIGLLDSGDLKPVLITPVALFDTGEKIAYDDDYFASDDLTTKARNALKGRIEHKSTSILSDANDWGMLLPPSAVDMIEMGYLNGRTEPELFVSDGPTSEQVFMNDTVRYKIRHEYAGAVVDYRSGYKAVVA